MSLTNKIRRELSFKLAANVRRHLVEGVPS